MSNSQTPDHPYHTPRRTPADPLASQLRRAFRESSRSLGSVSRDAGLDRRALARFVVGAREEITIGTADAIADALGQRITLAPAPTRRRGKDKDMDRKGSNHDLR